MTRPAVALVPGPRSCGGHAERRRVNAPLLEPCRPLDERVGESAIKALGRLLHAGTASVVRSHVPDTARGRRFLNATPPARREELAGAMGAMPSNQGVTVDTMDALEGGYHLSSA